MRERITTAPVFRHPPPGESLLNELVARYTHITGDPVRGDRPNKRNLIAACHRVHGDGFLPLVQRLFARTGTATNLLGEIRCLDPVEPTDDPAVPVEQEWDAWDELEGLAR